MADPREALKDNTFMPILHELWASLRYPKKSI